LTPDLENQILDALERISQAQKAFDENPNWVSISDNRGSERLELTAALQINGVLGGGVSLRINTPRNSWEKDVYGHIEVRRPDMKPHARLAAIEWRPRHDHTNPPYAPYGLRLKVLSDRWHSFDDNRHLGIEAFTQSKASVARPLPRTILSFREYIELAAEIWNFPEATTIETPEWSRLLL
jgi:hypothetical protein